MTTYTTPQFATGPSDRNLRLDRDALNRARPAAASPHRPEVVSDPFAQGPTRDWQPGASTGVPKAAVGALGAALVGGVALAIVLMAPSNKVATTARPVPIAQAAAHNAGSSKSLAATDAAISELDRRAPAAGNAAATGGAPAEQRGEVATDPAPAARTPAQSTGARALTQANAPAARSAHLPTAPVATPRAAPTDTQEAPSITPDTPAVPAPQAEPQVPAMQQTPEAPTVKPSVMEPAPADPAPVTPASPAPAQ